MEGLSCGRCGIHELPLVPSTCIQCQKPLCASCTVTHAPLQCGPCAEKNVSLSTKWLLEAFVHCNPTKCRHCLQWNLQYECVGCATFRIDADSANCPKCDDDTPHAQCKNCRKFVCMTCLGPNKEPQCRGCEQFYSCPLCNGYMPSSTFAGLCVRDGGPQLFACWWCREGWILFATHARRRYGPDMINLILYQLLQ